MKCYTGIRDLDQDVCNVRVDGRPLDLRLDLGAHSPDGFEWGYGGAGAAQLAVALLADAAGDEVARQNQELFKRRVIAGLGGEWMLTEAMIRDWVATHGRGAAAPLPLTTAGVV